MRYFLLLLITYSCIKVHGQSIDCEKLVSLFIENRENGMKMLEINKWKMYDSISYKRPGTTKTEHRFFYEKKYDTKTVDSIVFIDFTDGRFPFFDTAITGRPTIIQYKTVSTINFKRINDALMKEAIHLFDTTTNKGVYSFYDYKKAIVEIVQSIDNGKPVYVFWVTSKLRYIGFRPEPRPKSNVIAPPVEVK